MRNVAFNSRLRLYYFANDVGDGANRILFSATTAYYETGAMDACFVRVYDLRLWYRHALVGLVASIQVCLGAR